MPKPRAEMRTTELYLREIPRDLRDMFKSWCAARGITMKEKIVQMMRTTISEKGTNAIRGRAKGA